MKIQYKAALLMCWFGVLIVILLSAGYDTYSHKIVIKKEITSLKSLSEEVALHLDSHIKEKAAIATTLSSSPLLKNALLKSNSEFASFSDNDRDKTIGNLNQQWRKTEDINDPFIQAHMTNPVAEYLNYQQIIMPGVYGEIFLTNRFGVMIATTGKLTTLAHSHKYWWVACYDNGKGKIFLDDRGFDTSVQGYVLGVVIPIKDKNEIIGILKCNVNIMGPLTDVVQEFGMRHPGSMKIVRTGGLVVSEYGASPLSTQVNDDIIELLRRKESGASVLPDDSENHLVSYSPIPSTMGSDKLCFGGNQESIDHIMGNKGEGWHVVLSLNKKTAEEAAHKTTKVIIISGIVFTLITAIAALILGERVSKPIVELADVARTVGQGNLDVQAKVKSIDEIGSLATSFNQMTKNLKETMTTRDKLLHEIERRKKEEEKKEQLIIKLQEALDEVKTLRGIIPICSYCKKIRDDKGFWQQVEVYVEQHSDADFSHSYCPECIRKHFPDLADKILDT